MIEDEDEDNEDEEDDGDGDSKELDEELLGIEVKTDPPR
jgi:hypothetical protein